MDVQLYVYDLSRGLARQFSQQFLGTQIDAVYHTSIVLEGIEYFYGAGVQTAYAGSTHHGQPMEKCRLGKTDLPMEIILEYLESLKKIYTMEAYDLFLHNCNNFSNDFAMFLVSEGIPEHITSLPQTVLNTPFGQMLKPQLDAAIRPITQAPVPAAQSAAVSASRRASSLDRVRNVASLAELESLLQSASRSCAVIFFTSSTCAPCKTCYSTYDELAEEAGSKATLIKIDIDFSQTIASAYGVRATPTFVTFLKGVKEDEWAGTDRNKLREAVRLLVSSAHPAHPHSGLRVPTLSSTGLRTVRFTKMPPLEKVIAKLGPLGTESIVGNIRSFIEAVHGKRAAQDAPVPPLPAFASFLQRSLNALPPDDMFAAYDLFRLAVADPRVGAFFAEEKDAATILQLIKHVNFLGQDTPYNLRIVSLHVACNLFASHLAGHVILSKSFVVKELLDLMTSSLLEKGHVNVRVAAASLCFNLAVTNHRSRVERKVEILQENEQIELAAGVLEALGREGESKETIKALVMALGYLIYLAPKGGDLLDLCRVMDADVIVKSKLPLSNNDTLLKEVADELLGKGLVI